MKWGRRHLPREGAEACPISVVNRKYAVFTRLHRLRNTVAGAEGPNRFRSILKILGLFGEGGAADRRLFRRRSDVADFGQRERRKRVQN